MSTASLDDLKNELAGRGLLTAPQIEDTFVYGQGRFSATGADVMVNVDPEVEERGPFEVDAFADAVRRLLNLTVADWGGIVDAIAGELEAAVGSEPVEEQTDLRDDLALTSIVVFADATLLSFDAPRQFPDSLIRAQLDPDLAVEDVEVDERDDDGTETLTFSSLDALLDHLSAERPES
ncbi:hypothetical protein LLS1_23970 [Leifsonia sp. LS1]|uniref:cytochrome C5 n=1 Tax=Leifsonia sp. LS1 TaxID=2828483 RepID=UPI001CFF0AAA|nr:cytochrome C5 [Leifsonia sp. LS1]GIT80728.1 hypothetical protein LLS1_23970 [Leifsonia sp. LS1]